MGITIAPLAIRLVMTNACVRPALLLLLLGLLAGLFSGSPVGSPATLVLAQEAKPEPRPAGENLVVLRVNFRGNRKVEDDAIRVNLRTMPGTTLTQDLFMNLKSTVPELWNWLTGEVAEAEAEESVPFVGWVIRIIAIAGTTGDIVASEAEIVTNPFVISNTVSFTSSVTVARCQRSPCLP